MQICLSIRKSVGFLQINHRSFWTSVAALQSSVCWVMIMSEFSHRKSHLLERDAKLCFEIYKVSY